VVWRLARKPRAGAEPTTIDALRVRGLHKSFSAIAVDDLDLTVAPSELYALLGAGKTATLRMIAGLLEPDAGSFAIFGIDALADPVAATRNPTRRMIDRSRWCEGLKDPVAGGNGRDAVGFAE
jgi:ABC-type uncharacterized transport system ATPase subunit